MAKILVIDDDPSVTLTVSRALKSAGHSVTVAAQGEEGIRSFHEAPAELVITDIFMPEHDGIQLINHFRKLFPRLPIIAMSGNSRAEMLEVALKLGVVAALEKPFAMNELLKAIDDALKK
jgi:DNA-binding NtrC family response regulator